MERKNLWAPWRIKYIQSLSPVRGFPQSGVPNSTKGPEGIYKSVDAAPDDANMAQKGKISKGVSKSSDCFICEINKSPRDDDKNLVLWRSARGIVILNRFPYNNGHLLIAPVRHIPDLQKASDEELLELMGLVRESQKALSLVIKPHGFNVGMNFGRCAGAGLPEHLHIHLVPRWDGDTNFMNVCSDTDVISQSLIELLEQLKQVSKEHNLPRL